MGQRCRPGDFMRAYGPSHRLTVHCATVREKCWWRGPTFQRPAVRVILTHVTRARPILSRNYPSSPTSAMHVLRRASLASDAARTASADGAASPGVRVTAAVDGGEPSVILAEQPPPIRSEFRSFPHSATAWRRACLCVRAPAQSACIGGHHFAGDIGCSLRRSNSRPARWAAWSRWRKDGFAVPTEVLRRDCRGG